MKKWMILAAFAILLAGCAKEPPDKYGRDYNFTYSITESGLSVDDVTARLEDSVKTSTDTFERAEYLMAISRLKKDNEIMAFAKDFYHKAAERVETKEEKALVYEAIASIEGGRYYLLRAAESWREAGDKNRMMIDFNLAIGRNNVWKFDIAEYKSEKKYSPDFSAVEIGRTAIELGKEDVIVSQADRVTRDIMSGELGNPFTGELLTVFSEQFNYTDKELLKSTGWHEGARIKEMKSIGLTHKVAAGTIVKELDGKWYAPNEEGVFMFEVPIDKILYPTTKFIRKDVAVVIDTHGVNMIVGQAIKDKATAVIACCDHPGKIKAAKYLSDKGVKVICNTDKYVPLLIGADSKVVGSAPFSMKGDRIVIGNRMITIEKNEPVVVEDTVTKIPGISYYDTPARYFSELEKKGVMLNTYIAEIDGFNQMEKVIRKAKEKKANIIAVRIFNSDDYNNVKAWLEQNPEHKAILFHSEPYPYGYKLSREFKSQTSFDDPNPVLS